MRQFMNVLIGQSVLCGLLFLCIFASPVMAEDQPIAFSHKLHADQNQIPCQYCHLYARRSFSSGVPPVSVCVGCHGTNANPVIKPESKEVNTMRDYWDKKEPIPWVKIHDIPDFVRFPHKAHINAPSSRFIDSAGQSCSGENDRSLDCKVHLFKQGGDERCTACHGDLKAMDVVQKVDKDFGMMGWCLECHLQVKGAAERKSAMSTMGGWFRAKEEDEERAKKIQLEDPRGFHSANLTDCFTCHY